MKGEPLFLEAAFAIGARLCRDALWHGPQCTWAGPANEEVDGSWRVIPRVWGADLYAGTSGNALFLARLYRATGEKILRQTAEGAARHALSLVDSGAAGESCGFYGGRAGIAYACVELGEACGDERWIAQGRRLFLSLESAIEGSAELDLVGGIAGMAAALLRVFRRHGGEDLLALALRCGEKLADGRRAELTGFSHGAAGIAWALLELFEATGEARFREAAREAFRYENSTYDPWRESWPDLRDPAATAYPCHWCHGAAGIGLSRLRAWELLGEPALRAEAEQALRATLRDLASRQPTVDNFSLCHGFAGSGELLLAAARTFGDPAYFESAARVGHFGLEHYARNGERWSSGLRNREETPSLMLGSAGTGHFYLRLHDPEATPPILILL